MADRHLVIFDVDGTIVDSVKTDFQCFEAALENVFPFYATDILWDQFPNMTDSALINDVVQERLNRNPTQKEITNFKEDFFDRLLHNLVNMQPLPGVEAMLVESLGMKNFEIAFATGCWKRSASIKLTGANIDIDQFAHATSDDHFMRTKIITHAIKRAEFSSRAGGFNSVTYVGDGLWDHRSALKLGINFVGVDLHRSGVLEEAGAGKVVTNFENISSIEELIS